MNQQHCSENIMLNKSQLKVVTIQSTNSIIPHNVANLVTSHGKIRSYIHHYKNLMIQKTPAKMKTNI